MSPSLSQPSSDLSQLFPSELWRNFSQICEIPHPSEHETEIISFIQSRANSANLDFEIDNAGNLIVRKPASKGMEDRKGIILQAHVDMVPQANSDTPHDFTKDPITPRIIEQNNETWVKASGTTLGADNGIGVATMLAIMDSNTLKHGPLEFVFTVEEETGLVGALSMQQGSLKGCILINLDSEEDGDIIVGCAGGRDVTTRSQFDRVSTPNGHTSYTLEVLGLKGGHSGIDIHLGRGNAIRCLLRLLRSAISSSNEQMYLAEIAGGSARNAIPREASSTFTIPENCKDNLQDAITLTTEKLAQELAIADPNLSVKLTETNKPQSVFTATTSSKLVKVLYGSQDGIQRLSDTLAHTPETSSNFGVIKTEEDNIHTVHMVRSNIDSARDALCEQISDTYAALNSTVELSPAYPGWAPNPNHQLPHILSDIFHEQNGRPANITTIHAGLECAILGAPYPHWEMAAIGPTICNPHSPDECVQVESVGRFWNWLTAALEQC